MFISISSKDFQFLIHKILKSQGSPSTDNPHKDNNDSDYQQNMDEAPHGERGDHPEEP